MFLEEVKEVLAEALVRLGIQVIQARLDRHSISERTTGVRDRGKTYNVEQEGGLKGTLPCEVLVVCIAYRDVSMGLFQ